MIAYGAYIAPALLAVSAMNGAIYDSTWNVFFKLNFGKLYQTMLLTSLGPVDVAIGEITLALLRGGVYAVGFLIVMQVMGLVLSPLALLAIPAVILIAAGFAAIGMAFTSYMKTFQQKKGGTSDQPNGYCTGTLKASSGSPAAPTLYAPRLVFVTSSGTPCTTIGRLATPRRRGRCRRRPASRWRASRRGGCGSGTAA
jgi:hypothetical protein